MLTRCRNILWETQHRLRFGSIFQFASHYQPPTIDNLPLSDYQEACLKGQLVDKSKFICEIQNYRKGLLITRPRRWGKTMNLQMLEAFYGYTENISLQNFNKALFLGGDVTYDNEQYRLHPQVISEQSDFCQRYQGRYPIIQLTLKKLKENTKQGVKNMLYESIGDAYRKHIHLFNRLLFDEMSEFTQEQKQSIDYSNLHNKEYSVLYQNWLKYAKLNSNQSQWIQLADKFLSSNPNEILQWDIQTSILELSQFLTEYYQKPSCMLLIDEYDLPLNNLYTESPKTNNQEALKSLLGSLESMFDYGVKHNYKVNNTIVVGILPLQSYSWNCLVPCAIDRGHLNDSFGFTQDEVDKEIEKLTQITDDQKSQLKDRIGDYYNGYTIGRTLLYNPFSVSNCLLKVRSGEYQNCLQSFCYSSDSLLFLENIFKQLDSYHLEKLVNNKTHHYSQFFKLPLSWSAEVNETYSLVPALWNLGYLTTKNEDTLKVPNVEVTIAMKNAIYPYYLKNIRESYPNLWGQLDGNLENTNDYFEVIRNLVIPEFNKQYEEDKKDISQSAFRGVLSAYALTTNHLSIRQDEKTKENKLIDILYSPYSGNVNDLIIHYLIVNQVARNKSEANEETLEDSLWQILCNLYPSDRLREHGSITQQLIIRVLLFAKIKTDSNEEYSFEGSGYNFKTAEAKEMMKLFENYDEKQRRVMSSMEVEINERKAARDEFLEHCKAASLFELLEKYQGQQS